MGVYIKTYIMFHNMIQEMLFILSEIIETKILSKL